MTQDGKPLAIDLFCGLGGWTEGLLAEDWEVIGFDIEQHQYGEEKYPAQLVLQDILTLHGSQFRNADLIVASPPCQEYSYMAMPFSRGKRIAAEYRSGVRDVKDLTALFDACFRIQREASEAAGREIPMVVENVKGAQPWVGPARAHFGSFYLWGNVESVGGRIVAGRLKFGDTLKTKRTVKVEGFNFHEFEKTGEPGRSFQSAAVNGIKGAAPVGTDAPAGTDNSSWFFGTRADPRDMRRNEDGEYTRMGLKNDGGSWFAVGSPGQTTTGQNPVIAAQRWRAEHEAGVKCHGQKNGEEYAMTRGAVDGTKQMSGLHGLSHPDGKGGRGLGGPNDPRRFSSRSNPRKAASAQIAKIPFALSSYIARAFKPDAFKPRRDTPHQDIAL